MAKTLPEFDPVAAEHIMPIFIDLNVIPKEGRILAKEEEAQNNDTRNTEPTQNGTQKLKHYKPDPSKNLISDISNCGDALKMTMPVVETTTKPLPSQRWKRGPALAALSVPLQKRPEWLPCGWWIDYRVRSSGASAGLVDKYYFEPLSGRRFRSKKEVDYFIQTGSKRKRKTNPDADVNSSVNPGGHQQKKSGSRMERSAPLKFDFNNEPEKVRWVLTDALKDKWTPFVGDKLVPKSTRQEWNSAFRLSRS